VTRRMPAAFHGRIVPFGVSRFEGREVGAHRV
jgi:hypothetical protein